MKKTLMAVTALLLCLGSPTTVSADEFVFTAPPREKPADGQKTYGPIAAFLSAITGHTFAYKQPDNWLSYMKGIRMGDYDLVFDGPHFVSWRVATLLHEPLVKLPGKLQFVVIARKDNEKIQQLRDLGGRSVCGHAPPNLATLSMQDQFQNPARQPRVQVVRGFANVYKAMLNGECDAAVIPAKIYNKLYKKDAQQLTQALYKSTGLPHQAISASTRIPPDVREQIRTALLNPEGIKATTALRKRFAGGKEMIDTTPGEHEGFGYLLSNFWGFELDDIQLSEAEQKPVPTQN